jgi:peptidoglycan hydrolase-like protein with peptidoglycan-binding domain
MKNRFKVLLFVAALVLLGGPSFARADTLFRQLEVGDRGSDVSALQTFLAQDTTIYPQGLVTGYFGFLTKAAVSNFQSRNGISAVGRVGPQTLPVINFQMANGNTGGMDLSAPAISSVNLSVSNTSATVTWTTNDTARGKFFYSTSPIRMGNSFEETGINSQELSVSGTLAPYDGVARTTQTVTITGLTPNTTYYYLVDALDASNNVSITLPSSFRTSQ